MVKDHFIYSKFLIVLLKLFHFLYPNFYFKMLDTMCKITLLPDFNYLSCLSILLFIYEELWGSLISAVSVEF